jgi:SAM-dependent methyltransferase
MPQPPAAKWPKRLPPLTEEQKWISEDFMKHWLEILPRRFGVIESFNHRYAVKHAPPDFRRTLEIGAGLGEHIAYEKLSPEQEANYYALEQQEDLAGEIRRRYPRIQAIHGDCQTRLPFEDGFFDRVIAVHVLEHLPNLPATVREVYRLCDQTSGGFSVVIPCEGSPAYSLARRISAQPFFESRYHQSYRWYIERTHINRPAEILEELAPYFTVRHTSYFPLFPLPFVALNLVIGLTLRPRPRGNKLEAASAGA